MVDADGDRTVIRFDDVKLNSGLKPGDLELNPPAGTRISHPLSGESQQ
jgi:outer membrane lipoprotein-sorting protein